MVHADTGWTVAHLLRHLDTAHNYIAFAGPIGAGKTSLAENIAAKTAARLIPEKLDSQCLKHFYDNPSGTAWTMELKFLEERSRLLAAGDPCWSDRARLSLSDFWFDQSAAFASVWLAGKEFDRFQQRWQATRAKVVQPKLIVVLTEPKQTDDKAGRLAYASRMRTWPGIRKAALGRRAAQN